MFENSRLLLDLFWRPAAAMSAILDCGSLLFASLAVLAVSLLLQTPVFHLRPWLQFDFYTPLLVLAVVYVPGCLLLSQLIAGPGGSFGTMFRRDYSPLLTCTAMAWSAANLPLVVAERAIPAGLSAVPIILAYLYFAFLMFFAVRTIFGATNGAAGLIVCLSWLPLVAALFLWGPLHFLLGWLASPFFLFYAYYYLGGEIGELGAGLRSRQNFRRMLDTAAVNPHDAEAQYQLGLIYEERRAYTEAIERFRKAVEIDPHETDAYFQLGRIAREQGRLADALAHFQTVIDQDEKHRQSEILRELGVVYLLARQYSDALHELEEYVHRRPYDPEGLYYYGQTLEGTGRVAEAREAWERAAEAVRTAPRYRVRYVARWSRLAQKQIRRYTVKLSADPDAVRSE